MDSFPRHCKLDNKWGGATLQGNQSAEVIFFDIFNDMNYVIVYNRERFTDDVTRVAMAEINSHFLRKSMFF